MGFFDFFSSSQSNETANTAYETGQQTQQGSPVNLAGLELRQGGRSDLDINIQSTDYGAIDDAFGVTADALLYQGMLSEIGYRELTGTAQFALDELGDYNSVVISSSNDARGDALSFGAGAFQSAADLTGEALDSALTYGGGLVSTVLGESNASRADALSFGAGAVNAGYLFSENAIDAVQESTINALSYGGGLVSEVIQHGNDSRVDGLSFAAGAFNEGVQASEAARVDALDFGAGAFSEALAASEAARVDALTYGAGAFSEALGFADRNNEMSAILLKSAFSDALEYGAGVTQEVLDAMDKYTGESIATVASFGAGAVETAVNSTRTEAAQALDKVINVVMLAVIGMAAVQVYKNG